MCSATSAADGGRYCGLSIPCLLLPGSRDLTAGQRDLVASANLFWEHAVNCLRDAQRKSRLMKRRFSASAQARPAYGGHLTEGSKLVSKQSKNTSRAYKMSARQYLSAGVTGAAMVGAGALLIAAPGAPAPTTAQVKLASTGFALPQAPADCLLNPASCAPLGGLGGLIGDAGSLTTLASAFAIPGVDTNAIFFGAIGSGGWLIGDGLSALELNPDCTANCVGGNGGLLGGSGGDGAFGGDGGNAGFWWGSGGDGGAGIDAVYDADWRTDHETRPQAATAVTPGSSATAVPAAPAAATLTPTWRVVDPDAVAAGGGIGGRGGFWWGDGGSGGEGGIATTDVGNAFAGNGGLGGDAFFGLGNGGEGGQGGVANSFDENPTSFAAGGNGGGGGDGAVIVGDGARGGVGGYANSPNGLANGGKGGLGGDANIGDSGNGGDGGYGYTQEGTANGGAGGDGGNTLILGHGGDGGVGGSGVVENNGDGDGTGGNGGEGGFSGFFSDGGTGGAGGDAFSSKESEQIRQTDPGREHSPAAKAAWAAVADSSVTAAPAALAATRPPRAAHQPYPRAVTAAMAALADSAVTAAPAALAATAPPVQAAPPRRTVTTAHLGP